MEIHVTLKMVYHKVVFWDPFYLYCIPINEICDLNVDGNIVTYEDDTYLLALLS